MIKLVCGCEVNDYEGVVDIRMKADGLCMFDGWVPAVEYLQVCNLCYEERYSKYPDLILSDQEEEDWMNSK